MEQMVVFHLDDNKYALPLYSVERILQAVTITCLPKASGPILGVINVHGRVFSVVNTRQQFGLPKREMMLSDQLIVIHSEQKPMALLVDRVTEVIEQDAQHMVSADTISHGIRYINHIVKGHDGLIFVLKEPS